MKNLKCAMFSVCSSFYNLNTFNNIHPTINFKSLYITIVEMKESDFYGRVTGAKSLKENLLFIVCINLCRGHTKKVEGTVVRLFEKLNF